MAIADGHRLDDHALIGQITVIYANGTCSGPFAIDFEDRDDHHCVDARSTVRSGDAVSDDCRCTIKGFVADPLRRCASADAARTIVFTDVQEKVATCRVPFENREQDRLLWLRRRCCGRRVASEHDKKCR